MKKTGLSSSAGMLAALFPAAAFAEDPVIPSDSEEAQDNAEAAITTVPTPEAVTDEPANDGPRTVVDSGECGAQGDNLTWVLYCDGELVISGYGAMEDYGDHAYGPWEANYTLIQSVRFEEGVNAIGFSFWGCYNIANVTIPTSVTSINNDAFYNCSGLTSITVDPANSLYASVDGVLFNKAQTELICCPEGKSGSYTVPAGVTQIGDDAFSGCRRLTSIALPTGVTSIGNHAFSSCSSVTSITLPASLTSIGDYALSYCGSLTSIMLPASLTSIGSGAFSNCGSLTSITLPSSLTSIGSGAFSNCGSLTSITVDAANIAYASVEGVLFNKTLTELVCFPAGKSGSYSVPSGVTGIANSAFSGCSSLTSITLPAGLISIGDIAFSGCSSLTSITLPASLTSIGNSAFSYCSSLTSITLPASLTSIDKSAFHSCSSLTSITLPEGLTSIGDYAFYNCISLTDVSFGGSERQRNERQGNGWSSSGNDTLFDAAWQYAIATVVIDVHSFAELKAAVQAWDGSDTYVYYNGSGVFEIEETITLPENFFFCADADNSTLLIPAGVTLTAQSSVTNAFYVENLVVEGTMRAYRRALYYRTLSGEIDWIRTVVDSGECGAQGDNAIWTLYSDGELVISGSGAMGDYEWSNTPWYRYHYSIQTVTVESGLSTIGDFAFYDCSSLTGITLPESLTSIGDYAFFYCSDLMSIALPDNLTIIGGYAFSCCSLSNIVLPESLTSIGETAFINCRSLADLSVGVSCEHYASRDGVLFNKTMTTLVCCPAGKVGAYQVPSSVTSIGNYSFYLCSGLSNVLIPESVKSIGNEAFSFCENLTSIIIPSSVTSIGEAAFVSCDNLTEFNVVTSNPCYTSLDGVLFNKEMTELIFCPGGKAGIYQMPNSVTSINDGAFYGCNNLLSVALPYSLTSIGYGIFYGCCSLSNISIPAGVTGIDTSAFYDCNSLTSIALPASLTIIGSYAFSNCSSLTDVFYGGTEQQRSELEGDGWDIDGNENLFNATWHYEVVIPNYDCVLPAGLRTIESEAMAGCAFEAVRIPDGATGIGTKAFAGSPNLEYVYIPESVTTIAADAFYQVTGLTIIGKVGSAAESFANAQGFTFIEG